MTDEEHDGVSEAIIEQFVKRRLPEILEMREDVRSGKRQSDGEIEVLSRLIERAENFRHFAFEFPGYQTLIGEAIDAYEEITELALRNERNAD